MNMLRMIRMIRTAALMMLTAALVSPAVFHLTAAETGSRIDEAVTLRETRHLGPENLARSETLFREELAARPDDARAHWEFAKCCFLLGDTVAEKKEKLAHYTEGLSFARRAVALDEGSAWAHLWFAVNLGRIGQVKGVLNSLSSVPEIRREVEKALAINPRLTGALDVRAVVNYELPGLFGGNLAKCIEDLIRAIEIDPHHTILYVDLAEAYARKKELAKARASLETLLAETAPTYPADYALRDRPRALELMKKLEKK